MRGKPFAGRISRVMWAHKDLWARVVARTTHAGARYFMHHVSVFSLSVKETEGVEPSSGVAVFQPGHPAKMTRTNTPSSSATQPSRTCSGRPSIAANTWIRRAPTTTGDRCGHRRAGEALLTERCTSSAEIKLRDNFLMTRRTHRKLHTVPGRCDPV